MPIHEDQILHSRQKSFSTSSVEPTSTNNFHPIFNQPANPIQVVRLSELVLNSPGPSTNHQQCLIKHESYLKQSQTTTTNKSSDKIVTSSSAINYKRPIESDVEENPVKKFEYDQEICSEEIDSLQNNHFVLAPTPAQLGRAPLQRRQNSGKLNQK